jgi:rare lipoprotein A
MRGLAAAAAALALLGCQPRSMVQPKPDPHFVLGPAWRVGPIWHYPRESYDLNETGLAEVIPAKHPPLTSNGEVFDPAALAAAHPTLQLPAIARITNLDNGRSMMVRINDRGAGNPHRLVELTQRTAALLGINGVARVRLQVLANESHAAADTLPGAPHLAMAAVPRAVVEVAELPPPPGARQRPGAAVMRGTGAPGAGTGAEEAVQAPPRRLPEIISQGTPSGGRLLVRLDTFQEYQYAAVQRARMIAFHPVIVSLIENRAHFFRVEIGPLPDVRQAENALDQAFAAGIPDARIVVD